MRALFLSLAIAIGTFAGMAKNADKCDTIISARHAFVEMPGAMLDILDRSTRLDMLDYYDADSLWMAPNALDGHSVFKTVTQDFIEVQITDVSTLQIRILPKVGKSGSLVATCYTIASDGVSNDSELRFFDACMKELPVKNFFRPLKLKDFFDLPKGSLTSMREIEEMVPFSTVEYKLEADKPEITARLTVKEYINQDDIKILELFQKPPLHFKWDGKKFEPLK